jgi:hypothetical protein
VDYGVPPAIARSLFIDISRGRLANKWKPATLQLLNELRSVVRVEPLSPEQAEAAAKSKQVLSGVQASAGLKSARIKMWIGGLLVAGGGLATIITYSIASSNTFGGTYIVAWGPMVYGAFLLISGIVDYRKFRAATVPREQAVPSESVTAAPAAAVATPPEPASDRPPDIQGMRDRRDVDGLVGALWNDELDVRARAMDALAELKDRRAVGLLLDRLRDPRWDVRWSAAEALGRMGDPGAVQPLRAAAGDENALVRAVAKDSIRALAGP